ncbi:MAG: hypothetical protein M3Y87_16125, partial [Myxococcota bacterium]|nr:hypothetical protein [Myxococcota bacterium]
MRFSVASILALSLAIACSEPAAPPVEPAPIDPTAGLEPWSDAWIDAHAARFLDDDAARRAALEASLTNPENLYSAARLNAYARGRSGWDALPAWSPRVQRIDAALAAALARGEHPEVGDDAARIWDGRRPSTHAEWVALGERVFFELPLRSEPFWEIALRDPARGEELGVIRAPDGSIPGLVRMRDVDGSTRTGITCALCHT